MAILLVATLTIRVHCRLCPFLRASLFGLTCAAQEPPEFLPKLLGLVSPNFLPLYDQDVPGGYLFRILWGLYPFRGGGVLGLILRPSVLKAS